MSLNIWQLKWDDIFEIYFFFLNSFNWILYDLWNKKVDINNNINDGGERRNSWWDFWDGDFFYYLC